MKQAIRVMRLDFLTVQEYLSLKNLAMFVGMAVIVSLANKGTGGFSTWIMLMYGMLFASYPFGVGEKTEMELFYASLPLRRSDLVRGRYLYALCIQVLAAVVALILALTMSMVLHGSVQFLVTLGTVGICFLLFSIISMAQIPLFFKLGYNKARMLAIIPLVLLGALVAGLSSAWSGLGRGLDEGLQAIANNGFLVALVLLVMYGLTYKISCAISLRFYEKRDF